MFTNEEGGTSIQVDVPEELRKERVLSDEELIEMAQKQGIDLRKYEI